MFVILVNNVLLNDMNIWNGSEFYFKFFSCEWSDLDFFIIFGLGIVVLLCVLIGGFYVFFGEDEILYIFVIFGGSL